MKRSTWRYILLVFGFMGGWSVARGTLVAQYDFENADATDSSGSANVYDLALSAGTVAPTYLTEAGNTFVRFAGSQNGGGQALETAPNALEPNDDDGNDNWIVSLWFRTDDWSQGSFRGIFATSNNNGDSRGWQLDSTGGAGRVVRNDNGTNTPFNWSTQPTLDECHHLYVVKRSNSDWELYMDQVSILTDNTNLGRVDEIRLGTIRNGVNGLRMDMDYVQVWDGLTDPGTDLAKVYADGVAHLNQVPEPHGALLLGLGLVLLRGCLARR